MMLRVGQPGLRSFLTSSEACQAVDVLSATGRLTVFVGAGISKEAGLPSWPELIDRVLSHVARTSDPFRSRHRELSLSGIPHAIVEESLAEDAREYARWIVATHGLLGAAAVVKAWLEPEDYRRVVETCLYEPVTAANLPLQPGPTAMEVARLWREVGPYGLTVVTTNYDLLLERALREVGVAQTEISTATQPPARAENARYSVIHLHGIVREPHAVAANVANPGNIVLAEDEYLADDDSARGRRAYCENLLKLGPCLFIGTSLTDPNLLTYLYSSAAARGPGSVRHYAIMVKQGDQPPQIETGATVLEAARQAAAARLARMNVIALQPEFFCQTAHFLADIRDRRKDPSRQSYVPRLTIWADAAVAAGVLPDNRVAFCERQPWVQRALAGAVAAITNALEAKPSLRCSDEALALHLWAHDPNTDSLVFVARSDQQFFNPATLERQQLAMPIRRLVVEAVCSGSVLEASGDELRSSRWRSMLVVPIISDDDHHLPNGTRTGSLPVGALVLASNRDGQRGLSRLRDAPRDRAHLVSALSAAGSLLLTPSEMS